MLCRYSDVFRRYRDLKPNGIGELNEAGNQLAQALAEEVAVLIDQMKVEVENA